MDTESFFMLLLAAVFIGLNGFFVFSEFALVKARKSKLEEFVKAKVTNSRLALKMTNSIDTYLSATQLGITLASLALGWIGEPAVATLVRDLLTELTSLSETGIHTIAFAMTFTLITLLHVVLGEQVPKLIAIANAEKMALIIARPLHIFWIVFFPVIKTFDYVAIGFVRLLGVKPVKESELAHSEEEIKIIVGESLKGGVLDNLESEIIQNAVDFSDTVAKEVMTPRKDMICLDKQHSLEQNLKVISESKFTRFPYIDGNKDIVLGMIHIRDIMQNSLRNIETNLDEIVRKFIIVPENSSISKILAMMNKDRISAALVVDEYGGTAGLLTMEDIIEEVLGDINDEHDGISADFKKISESDFEFKGRFDLESAGEIMGVKFDEETEQLTIGGYVFNLFERLPVVGDKIEDESCIYEVLQMDGSSIGMLKITIKEVLFNDD